MIIWRGWGIVAVPVVLACIFGIGFGLSAVFGREPGQDSLGPGLGLLVAAVATFYLGSWMNRRSASKAAERYAVGRREQLYQQVDQAAETQTWRDLQGLSQQERQLRWPDQHSRRWSELEAAAMAQLDREHAEVRHRSRNHHSLFFIPLQWLWVPLVVGGAAAIISSLSAG